MEKFPTEGKASVNEGSEGGKMSRRDFVAKAAAGLFSLFVGGSVLTSCGNQVPNEGDTNEDEPTTVSDVTLSVLDRVVPDDANGVYAGGQVEISGTLSDPDGLPTQANLVLEGVGVSYPVTINPDGTFSGTVDSSGLPVGIYSLTLSGQDGQGNPFNLDLGQEIRVYPWGEVVDSTIKVVDELGSPDSSYREARYNGADLWWLDTRDSKFWIRVKGITQQMVDEDKVRILVEKVGEDIVGISFPAEGFISESDGGWVAISNQSLFPGTGHDGIDPESITFGGVIVNGDTKSYISPKLVTEPIGDGVF